MPDGTTLFAGLRQQRDEGKREKRSVTGAKLQKRRTRRRLCCP